ncbi:hypothetical protein HDU76_009365 [Blyttiomyces sp. JEL0837]|nr:hypothetical protein HDU76_009365 [Blyttiomyces sp. JEL0837]
MSNNPGIRCHHAQNGNPSRIINPISRLHNPNNNIRTFVPRVLPYLIVYTVLSLGMLSGLVILVMLIGCDYVPFEGGFCYGGSRLRKRLKDTRNNTRYTKLGEDIDGNDGDDHDDVDEGQHFNEQTSLLDG